MAPFSAGCDFSSAVVFWELAPKPIRTRHANRQHTDDDETNPAELASEETGLCTTSEAGVVGVQKPKNHRGKLCGAGERHHVAADFENLVLRIVGNQKRDRNVVMCGRPQGLNAVKRRPVADQSQHRPVGPGQLDPQGATQSPPQRPAAMPEESFWIL